MKKLLLLGMAACMMASCSQDETIEKASNGMAIEFNGFVNKSTKATDIDNNNFNKFAVWGLMSKGTQTGNPFVAVDVTKGTDSKWTYATPVYWENGYNYSFIAVAPYDNDKVKVTAPTEVGTYGSIDFTSDGKTDLIYDGDGTYATTKVSVPDDHGTGCPAAIHFTFKHLLSRVKFAFTNGMDDGSLINVTDIKITNVNTKATATLNVDDCTWELAADNVPATLDFGKVILGEGKENFAATDGAKESEHFYMIPKMSDNQEYEVTFKVTRVHNGVTDTYDHTVKLPVPTDGWKAGFSYAFVAKLDANNVNPDSHLCPIVFEAEVKAWEDFGDNNMTL
ncbi:MAG: fimbrillin family protein [Lepagella sp.]